MNQRIPSRHGITLPPPPPPRLSLAKNRFVLLVLSVALLVGAAALLTLGGPLPGPEPALAQNSAPMVTAVAVSSDAGNDDTYLLGDAIRITLTFSQAVNVTGTPSLKIDMDPADWGEKQAAYESGSGSSSLVFAHEVVEPNLSTQGIAVLADSLALNGGTIQSASSQTEADLSHSGLDHDASHKVNWQASASTVSAVAITSDAGDDDTYGKDDVIQITLTFSEAVEVTGTPQLDIDMDPADWGTKPAAYHSGSGTTSLTFTHTVVEPNLSTQGIAVLENTLELNGGTIQSASAQIDADVSHVGLAHDASHKVDWQHSPPATIPTVSAVAITSDAGDDDTYGEDDVIQITLTFSEAVDVSGSPQLTIKMDPDYGEKQAGYHIGTGTASLVFTDTVVEPNLSTQGIAVLADSLALNGGTIQSAESDTDADLSHSGLDHDASHKVDWQAEPNDAPVINTQSAGYADFTFRGNAPRGILVSKRFDGIFSDPDGDNLTYSVAMASDNSRLVGQLRVSDFGDTDAAAAQSGYPLSVVQRVYFETEAEADWKAMNPQPPVQPVATVTLTATDPRGLSASVNGDFLIHWETYPELESVVAGTQAITLSYDMAVLNDPAPTPGQFSVNVVDADGTTGTIAVSRLTVSGPVVTLELASELSEGQTVTLDYANATKTPVRAANGWGHGAHWFRGHAVDMSQPTTPTIDLRLERAVDNEGEVRPRTVTVSWNPVPGAASYTLSWQRVGQDSQAASAVSGNSRRQANVQAANRLTVPAARTSADITVPDDGEWEVQLNARGAGDEIIARSPETEIRQTLEQQGGTSEPTASLTFKPTSVAAGEYISVRLTANSFPSEVSFKTYRPDSEGDYRRTQELRIQYTEEQARILSLEDRDIYPPFTMKDGLVLAENTGDGASSERVWAGRMRTDDDYGMRELEATAKLVWTEDGTEREQLVTGMFTLTEARSSDLTENCPGWMDPGDSCTFSLTMSNYSGVASIENNQATITQLMIDDFEVVEMDSPYSFSVPVTTSGNGKTTTFTATGTITIPEDTPRGSYEIKIPAQHTRSDGVQGAAWSFYISVAGELSAEISFEDFNNLDSGTFVTSVAPGSAVRMTLKAQHKRRLRPVDDVFKAVGPSPDESMVLGTATVEKFNTLLIGGPLYWWAYLQVPADTKSGDYSVSTTLEWKDANGASMTREITAPLTVLEPADVPRVPMPANVLVTLDGDSASLSWDAVSHAAEYAVEYRHKRAKHQSIVSIALMNWQRVEGLTATSTTVSDLRCSNTFEFRVQARGDGDEREDAWGAMTLLEGSTSECPDIEDPPAPVITSAVADGEDGIIVTWDGLQPHHGLGATRLEFREAVADSEWTKVIGSWPDFSVAGDGTVTFGVRGLTCGTTYEFRAFQHGDSNSYSNTGRYRTVWSGASNVMQASAPACQAGS